MATNKITEVAERPLQDGMTLRDYFAASVMAEMMRNNGGWGTETARDCYRYADLMLQERSRG